MQNSTTLLNNTILCKWISMGYLTLNNNVTVTVQTQYCLSHNKVYGYSKSVVNALLST